MWPWEHLAVAYLAASVLCRLVRRRPPTRLGVAAAVVGSQFPDLVDKPLGWVVGVLPSGTSLAHSLVTAVPVIALVGAAAWCRGRFPAGVAFGVGYLSHVATDLVYPVVYGADPRYWMLFWPLTAGPVDQPAIAWRYVGDLVTSFLALLAGPSGTTYLLAETALLAAALFAWLLDGRPGLSARTLGRS